jgi:hypothetical protein
MRYTSWLALPAMVLALGLGSAFAATVGGPATGGAGGLEGLVHKAHFCHRSCELGGYGWHRHVGPSCVRVACIPQARQPFRCFVDRWGVRRCRW